MFSCEFTVFSFLSIFFLFASPKPLALYVFSNDTKKAEEVFRTTTSGGGGLNECLMHNVCPELPFGGGKWCDFLRFVMRFK